MTQSSYIVFPESKRVALWQEAMDPPAAGEVLCEATRSLVSIGTETHCLRGIFDPGTNWEGWVRYPFRPGYCMVGQVVAVGKHVAGLKEGDRITSRTPHQQFFKLPAQEAYTIPSEISNEEATWVRLGVTTPEEVVRITKVDKY